MIGLKRGTVKLLDHDKRWDEDALRLIFLLKSIFVGIPTDIQHVGSTSIKNLKAKPIIDIAVAVNSFDDILPFIDILEENGMIHYPQNDNDSQIFFACGDAENNMRTHHIHVVKNDSEEWRAYIMFRDYLSTNCYRTIQYEKLKLKLMQTYKDDRKSYTKGKDSFIKSVIREAQNHIVLGKNILVKVDKTKIYDDATDENNTYLVNYGFAIGHFTRHSKKQGVYILGMTEDTGTFSGQVIAIANRVDDIEDIWIVAPTDTVIYEPEIKIALQPYEIKFNTKYRCLYEKSCGAVVYVINNNRINYLIIKSVNSHFGFPKGHMEIGENEEQTATREVFEEVGLAVNFVEGFREVKKYTLFDKIKKEVVYFLSESKCENIALMECEVEECNLVTFEEAMIKLTYFNDKVILKKANDFLKYGK